MIGHVLGWIVCQSNPFKGGVSFPSPDPRGKTPHPAYTISAGFRGGRVSPRMTV